jgi:hypothetical protein
LGDRIAAGACGTDRQVVAEEDARAAFSQRFKPVE